MNWQCPFGRHADWHRGRLPAAKGETLGKPAKICDRCHQPIGLLLAGEMITDPLPQSVAGQPTGRAIRERRQNVTPWKVSGR